MAERSYGLAEVHSYLHPTLPHGALEPPEQSTSNPPPAGWNQADKPRDVRQHTRRQQDAGCHKNQYAVNEWLGRELASGPVGPHAGQRTEPLMPRQ